MNKLFIGKSTFYKAAIYNITPKKSKWFETWLGCMSDL